MATSELRETTVRSDRPGRAGIEGVDRAETVAGVAEGVASVAAADDASAARARLCIALDVASTGEAIALARRLRSYFEVAKVGLELFVAEGPAVVRAVIDEGFDVFLDLKLHDIPTTVGHAAARAAETGARYLTAHAGGGEEMLRAAVEGFFERGGEGSSGPAGSSAAGSRQVGILGVTVLTSDRVAPPTALAERASVAKAVGCAGLVCAAPDLEVVGAVAGGLVKVVPGIRLSGAWADDQARVATPAGAIAAGADLLVIGRTVTAADDPVAAARRVNAEVRDVLSH